MNWTILLLTAAVVASAQVRIVVDKAMSGSLNSD